ncbi:MAG: SRPBCC family protein [Flavobacteriales bacterium]|nr:SRPBCC family protein [Flavobacteriales bacterium]
MPIIHLTTTINAPIKKCFDLARSIDFHTSSLATTDEKAIAGKTAGLIHLGEWVTWRAKHFGIYQTLTSTVIAMDAPWYFADEMTEGIFTKMLHCHFFEKHGDITIMEDYFEYQSPLGWIGLVVDKIILKNYMTALLEKRNLHLKSTAERN